MIAICITCFYHYSIDEYSTATSMSHCSLTFEGATENAGVENAIRSKMQGWNVQEWKSRQQIAGLKNAGVEKSGRSQGWKMQEWKSRE